MVHRRPPQSRRGKSEDATSYFSAGFVVVPLVFLEFADSDLWNVFVAGGIGGDI